MAADSAPVRKPIVLLVEDDRHFRSFVGSLLLPKGVRVREACAPSEADLLLAKEKPDLVIVDGKLPEMTGLAYISKLRTTHPDLPVVFLSAHWRDHETYVRLTTELGVLRVLHKPISAYELLSEIMALIEKVTETPPAKAASSPPTEPLGEVVGATPEGLLQDLRQDFAGNLDERLHLLKNAAKALSAEPTSQRALEELHQVAHALHGTAGSYGFDAIANAAKELEAVTAPDAGRAPTAGAIATPLTAVANAIVVAQDRIGRGQRGRARTTSSVSMPAVRLAIILVASENEVARQRVVGALQHEATQIEEAGDVSVVSQRIQETKAELVVLDLDVPGVSGFDVCKRIRAEGNSVGIVLVTTRDRPEVRVAGYQAGADDVITVPCHRDEFVTRVFARVVRLRELRAPTDSRAN